MLILQAEGSQTISSESVFRCTEFVYFCCLVTRMRNCRTFNVWHPGGPGSKTTLQIMLPIDENIAENMKFYLKQVQNLKCNNHFTGTDSGVHGRLRCRITINGDFLLVVPRSPVWWVGAPHCPNLSTFQ